MHPSYPILTEQLLIFNQRTRRENGSRENTYSPRRQSKTPAPAPVPVEEDPGLKSGSEEGEIEEV